MEIQVPPKMKNKRYLLKAMLAVKKQKIVTADGVVVKDPGAVKFLGTANLQFCSGKF